MCTSGLGLGSYNLKDEGGGPKNACRIGFSDSTALTPNCKWGGGWYIVPGDFVEPDRPPIHSMVWEPYLVGKYI